MRQFGVAVADKLNEGLKILKNTFYAPLGAKGMNNFWNELKS